MAKWTYDLRANGTTLRELINDSDSSKESCEAILDQVVICCKYLQNILSDEDKDWCDDNLEELIQDCEDTKYYLDEDDEDLNEVNVDGILGDFYDLMDSMRVWVAF